MGYVTGSWKWDAHKVEVESRLYRGLATLMIREGYRRSCLVIRDQPNEG